MSHQKIQIKACFQAQYTLMIEMESVLINASMKSKTEIRYDFSVLSLSENWFECRLVQLDIFIHEANNTLINEVAELTGAFNRMFNELHLKVDHSGVVLQVINLELIRSKWKQTKELMQQAANRNPDIRDLISISDNLFTSEDKIQAAIQGNEFIQTYFGYAFDKQFPLSWQDSNRTNFFSTSYLPFSINVEERKQNSGRDEVQIITQASPAVVLDNNFKKNAYKSFEDKIDLTSVKPDIKELADHLIERSSGKLIRAQVSKQELVENNLFTKTAFTLVLENQKKVFSKETEQTKLVTHESNNSNSRFKFFS